MILSLPMLPVLKRGFPDASIVVLARRYTREILEGNSCVREVIEYEAENKLSSLLKILHEIRRRRFDIALLPYPRFRTALLIALSGIRIRVATGYRWYSFLFNKRVYEHRKDAKRHEVEYNLNLLSAVGIRPDGPPEFELSESGQVTERIDELLEKHNLIGRDKFIVLHPGSGGSARNWPAEKFSSLGSLISELLGYRIVVTGGKGEEELTQKVARDMKTNPLILAGALTLKELSALLRRATAFVSNSTGPLHIAAAIGIPVVAFYPPILPCSPVRWGPYSNKKKVFVGNNSTCPLCHGSPCRSDVCMENISVEEVFSGLKDLLQIPLPALNAR
jgi:lipopolysaccharide heptosyltransferase II